MGLGKLFPLLKAKISISPPSNSRNIVKRFYPNRVQKFSNKLKTTFLTRSCWRAFRKHFYASLNIIFLQRIHLVLLRNLFSFMHALNTINHRYYKVLAIIVIVFKTVWSHLEYACKRNKLYLFVYINV